MTRGKYVVLFINTRRQKTFELYMTRKTADARVKNLMQTGIAAFVAVIL